MMSRRMLLFAFVLPFAAGWLQAQGGVRNRPGALRSERRLEQQSAETPAVRRQRLEQQLRQRMWRVAKQRIGFTDQQMSQLERTSQRFDVRRRRLAQQERAERVSLRTQLLADSLANQSAIASSLDKLHDLQRQRLDVQTEEQKEFASFMTPLQRARFLALQEQVRKRMQELVRARPDSTSP